MFLRCLVTASEGFPTGPLLVHMGASPQFFSVVFLAVGRAFV